MRAGYRGMPSCGSLASPQRSGTAQVQSSRARAADAAANAIYSVVSSMGQLCVSIERIYVQRAVASAFTDALVDRVNSLRSALRLARRTRWHRCYPQAAHCWPM